MLLDCPSCAASYDEDPARLLPGAHPVRCPRCHAAWHPEILFDTNAGNDDASRIAMLTAGVCAARLSVQANRKQGTRIAALDAIERIREQAHGALNAVRLRYREDHSRIVSLQAARAAVPTPHAADELLAEAAPLPLQSPPLDAGRDLKTRMRISRAFAEALADVYGDTAGSNEYADRLPDNEQPRPDNETGSVAAAIDDEQPPDGGCGAAAVGKADERTWIASAADKRDDGPIAAFAASHSNERGAEPEELPAPASSEMEDRSTTLWQAGDCGLKAAPARPREDRGSTVSLTERKRPPTKEKERGIAGLRPRQKREHRAVLDGFVETRQREELIREARKAAQRAIRESAPAPGVSANGWQNMWIALFITSAILLVLRAWFH